MKYPVWIFLLSIAGLVCAKTHILEPISSKSSPSHIIATKGSSVWLHWNYIYIGDGRHGSVISTYKDQIIRLHHSSGTSTVLAKRIGQNGALAQESPIPAPFNGRVEVMSSNSTLVIHNLKYADELYHFTSTVTVDTNVGAGPHPHTFHLLPNVTITVHGAPSFTKEPPKSMDVKEGSNLLLDIYMDGNPKPNPYFKWSHHSKEWSSIMAGFQVYPYMYVAKYKLSKIDGSYCGRKLHIKLNNSIGSSTVTTSTTIIVLLRLDTPYLEVETSNESKCIEVKWKKAHSGACKVTYAVALKSASGNVFYSKTDINIGGILICNLSSYANITDVELTVSFKGISRVLTGKVSRAPTNAPATSAPTVTGRISTPASILSPIREKSSPSHIIAIKGSSVLLHWNYTYVRAGEHDRVRYKFREQILEFKTLSQNMRKKLAKRIGEHGALTLESPVPAPFNGRIEVISSNSSLVIHDIQYNDSTYSFQSSIMVDVDIGAGPKPYIFPMSHHVVLTVIGPPNFIEEPPTTLDVNEGSTLLLKFSMDGNPKPKAYFRWSHLPRWWSEIVPVAISYRFVYSSMYQLNNVDGSYCGRALLTKIKNGIRSSSSRRSTKVTVLLKLDRQFNLKAKKDSVSKCVQVKWKKVNSGACKVKYTVALKSESGKIFSNQTKENKGKAKICNISAYAKITGVQLTVSFKGSTRVVTAKVIEVMNTASAPTATAKITQKHSRKLKTDGNLPTSKPKKNRNPKPSSKLGKKSHNAAIIVCIILAVFLIAIGAIIYKIYRERCRNSDVSSLAVHCHSVDENDKDNLVMQTSFDEGSVAHRRSLVIGK